MAFLLAATVSAQISPGELTDAHAHLEGMSNCTECHVPGEEVTDKKCLDCHGIIDSLINVERGYHASSEVSGKKCYECHNEHHGRKFEIVHFDKNNFDHALAGYKLQGKHADTECSECHKKEFIKNGDLNERENTFLGLSENCISCHTDIHNRTLSEDCGTCHGFESFTIGLTFNHDNTAYPLTGKHSEVECYECHEAKRDNKLIFSGLKHNECIDCHNDPHSGRLGNNCSDCHTTLGFAVIESRNDFDHTLTRFPLKGAHKNVDCEKCHGANFKKEPGFEHCYDCHEDFHNGVFSDGNTLVDCGTCHTENLFTPSLFGIEEHNKTKFALDGSHLAVSCAECHKTAHREWKFAFHNLQCISCHENVHGNSMSELYGGDENCNTCHNTESWKKIDFEHDKTGFELSGKHAWIECSECHIEREGETVRHVFRETGNRCIDCHIDEHNGQFDNGGENYCTGCHGYENWEANKFDHSETRFPLDGAHSGLACIECHKEITLKGKTFIQYKFEDIKCAACHF